MRASVHALGFGSLLAGFALVACVTHEIPSTYGDGDDDDDSDGGETAENLPACSFSTTASGGTAATAFGRTFLICELGSADESCLSNDPTICPDHGSSVNGGTTISCSNQCEETQYGISVDFGLSAGADGGVITPTSPTLPSSCEQAGGSSDGVVFYCCDCPTGS